MRTSFPSRIQSVRAPTYSFWVLTFHLITDCCSFARATSITIMLVRIRSSNFILDGSTSFRQSKFYSKKLTLADRLRVTRRPCLRTRKFFLTSVTYLTCQILEVEEIFQRTEFPELRGLSGPNCINMSQMMVSIVSKKCQRWRYSFIHIFYKQRTYIQPWHSLVKPFWHAGLNSVEIVKLLLGSLQTELATPDVQTSMFGCVWGERGNLGEVVCVF